LPNSVKNTWQPDKFFRCLERLEPGSTSVVSLAIGKEDIPGVPAKNLLSIGKHRTFNIKWLSENYHKLGRYLHAQGKKVESRKLREDLIEIIKELDEIVNSPIRHFSMARRISLQCGKEVECLNEKCGIINFIKQDDQGKLSLIMTPYSFDCECGQIISSRQDELKIGHHFRCSKCKKMYFLSAFRVDPL
jgi:hypothetical protein